MELTKEEWEYLQLELGQAENIYDVLVAFYRIIDSSSMPFYIQEYSRYMEAGGVMEELKLLIEEMAGCDIDFERFLKELADKLTVEDARIQGIFLMMNLDHLLDERECYPIFQDERAASDSVLSNSGPLNRWEHEYGFYMLMNKSLVKGSKALQNCSLRFMNQTSGDNIFYRIKNYRIIKRIDEIPDIDIVQYRQPFFQKLLDGDDASFKIAVVPVSNRPWYDTKWKKAEQTGFSYFEIRDVERTKQAINSAYTKVLDVLENMGAEIVVFPEVSMNQETEGYVKHHLIQRALQKAGRNSIKLVFLGSLWKDGSNRCTLLSGSGTVLLRNDKKSPVELLHEGVRYQEELKKRPDRYTLLDVEGLGRILYLICKDSLEDLQQVHMWHDYGVNFEIISCYSKSISYFEEEADSFGKKYAGVSLLANSCEPRVNGKTMPNGERIGFLTLPCTMDTRGRRTSTMLHEYHAMPECDGDCRYCRCVWIFTVKPHLTRTDDIKTGLFVDKERCMLD